MKVFPEALNGLGCVHNCLMAQRFAIAKPQCFPQRLGPGKRLAYGFVSRNHIHRDRPVSSAGLHRIYQLLQRCLRFAGRPGSERLLHSDENVARIFDSFFQVSWAFLALRGRSSVAPLTLRVNDSECSIFCAV